MNRRELLKMIAVVTGGTVIGADVFLSGCTTGDKTPAGFTQSAIDLLNEVGETILPATNTPGARAADVGNFMKTIVTDCYTPRQQAVFIDGISKVDEACKAMHKTTFLEATPAQRHDLLISLEKEAKAADEVTNNANKQRREIHEQTNAKLAWKEQKEFEEDPVHYYTMMKQLTLWGYFSSKPGATEALRHVPVPGKYDGAYPYKKGDKAFS